MTDPETVELEPDPVLKAWLLYAILNFVLTMAATFGTSLLAKLLWGAGDVDPERACYGAAWLAGLVAIGVSFVCYRFTVRRFVIPPIWSAAVEVERTAGGR